jgi:tetratricopeptide (TPR) repeat protein
MGMSSGSLGTYTLKSLGARNLQAALDKAEQYRALNEPEEAESICRDILAQAPDHQLALRTLGLALTDRFDRGWTNCFDEALGIFQKLNSGYETVYYSGVAWERCAKAQLEHGQVHNAAHSFERAMELFAQAEEIGPKDSPDPILRWNRCVRAISAHPEILAALREPHTHEFQHGD